MQLRKFYFYEVNVMNETVQNEVHQEELSQRLFDAVKEITDEIEKCDKTIKDVEDKRMELKNQFQSALSKIQGVYGTEKKKTRGPKSGKTIRELVLDYLEKHREAKTSEIRKYLADL